MAKCNNKWTEGENSKPKMLLFRKFTFTIFANPSTSAREDSSRQFVIPFSFFYILNSYTIYTLKCRVDPGPERNSHSDTAKAEEGKKSILWHSSSRIANRVEELSVVSEIKWNGRNRKRVENIIIIIYSLSFVQKNTEKELYAVRGYKIVELGRASR